jgi:hypothetical protein
MKRILIVSWSQTGQLDAVVKAVAEPLLAATDIEVVFEYLRPVTPYPFPWSFLRFFDTFPETVYEEPLPLLPLQVRATESFDLIILAYQVWFLSPSQPMMAFLQSPAAAQLLHGKPVMTLIACRNMWLMAQEVMKEKLTALGAHLIDNAVLVDRANPAATFISTPLWMLTGKRGPFLGGRIPAAGIPSEDIAAAQRFGEAIAQQLPLRESPLCNTVQCEPMLKNVQAVVINERLIASEKIARRSFLIWGKGLRALGKPGMPLRRAVLCLYVVFLVLMIVTVVPLSAVIKRMLSPLTRKKIAEQRRYFALPSGEE